MGIKFLGTPIKQFDQLCSEEEIVMIEVKCYKREDMSYPQPEGGMKIVTENVQTGGWGRQIFSWKYIFQVDDEDDYPDKNTFSDKIRENMR